MKQIKLVTLLILLMVSLTVFAGGRVAFAENIDPDDNGSQYAYGENVGWLDAEPLGNGGPGMTVEGTKLTGYIWGENIGWVNLSCENTGTCDSVNYGVTNDGSGNLAGYAWGENVGWISFSCENTGSCDTVDYGVTIDPVTGEFSGYAWGENIGWITFRATAPVSYGVATSWTGATSVVMDLPAGWSMISLPVNPTDKRLKMLFPGAVVVYGYKKGTGYTRIGNDEALEVGKGYWILLNAAESYTLTGSSIPSYTTDSFDEWAMIGGCTHTARVVPHGCDIGVIYRYVQEAGYQRVTGNLSSGEGYWILVHKVTGEPRISVEKVD